MKNADSLSTKMLTATIELLITVNESVSPIMMKTAKIIPKTDATDALANAAYVHNLLFLCNTSANAAPIK